jgi:hypothetical protein
MVLLLVIFTIPQFKEEIFCFITTTCVLWWFFLIQFWLLRKLILNWMKVSVSAFLNDHFIIVVKQLLFKYIVSYICLRLKIYSAIYLNFIWMLYKCLQSLNCVSLVQAKWPNDVSKIHWLHLGLLHIKLVNRAIDISAIYDQWYLHGSCLPFGQVMFILRATFIFLVWDMNCCIYEIHSYIKMYDYLKSLILLPCPHAKLWET